VGVKAVTHMDIIKEGKAEVEDMAAMTVVAINAMLVEEAVMAVVEAAEEAVAAAATHGKTVQVWNMKVSW
jgi:hypothetical protein